MTRQSDIKITGGCQCGRIRYRLSASLQNPHICHCRMCQKAVGNAFAALAAVSRDDLQWTREMPAVFRSSDQVERGFCSHCGTPLYYDYLAGNRINITIGSLDNPADCPPVMQFGLEGQLPWFAQLPALPGQGTTEETMASIVVAIAASNHQHPDHD